MSFKIQFFSFFGVAAPNLKKRMLEKKCNKDDQTYVIAST